jgi:hypothetical protein
LANQQTNPVAVCQGAVKRWLPWFVGGAVMLWLLWRAFRTAGVSRAQRQGELDAILAK